MASGVAAEARTRAIPIEKLRSGIEFLSRETRTLWGTPEGPEAKSYAACHGEVASLKGAAARYPIADRATRRVINLEGRIQQCRVERQKGKPLVYESRDLLALTAVVAHQSRGMAANVRIDAEVANAFAAGRTLYYQRQGQLNLSCAQCHEDNWGQQLRADALSQGHPNGYPIYRLEWQTMGSLHRRLRSCLLGVRAEPFAAGAPELVNLELFLAWRAGTLPIETPAVRR